MPELEGRAGLLRGIATHRYRTSALRRLVLTVLTLASASCVDASHRVPSIAVPQRFAYDRQTVPEAALDRWWLLFDDRQLTALVEEGLANAPNARSAIAILDEARAVRSAALSRFAPQGGVNVSAGVQHTTVFGTNLQADQAVFAGSFTPSWEIDLLGRRAALRRTADADLDVAMFDYHAARQSLGGNIAIGLFEARAYAVRLDQARETLRIATELARVGERRVTAGIGSRVDEASLQADEASAQSQVQLLEARLDVAARTLLVLLGRGTEPVAVAGVTATLIDLPPVPNAVPATLLARRPDILRAEAGLRFASGTLDLDAKALLPRYGTCRVSWWT